MPPTDINVLNRRFGAPGRIAFRTDKMGAPILALVNRYGSCELSLYGGHVLDYRPIGHVPVLFMSKKSLFEPGKPIRGGIPVCWPWFGSASEKTLPLHGFARIMPWDLHSTEYSSDVTEARLSLSASEATRRFWPHAFELTLRVWLDQRLNLALTTVNRDAHPITFTQAFHPYFRIRQIMDVNVRGLDQAPYRDLLTNQTGTQTGVLNIRAETDRVYTPPAPECVLHDPGIGRALALAYTGAKRLVVWNPWIDKARAMPDFGDDEYTGMICLEPANTDGDEVTLEPGARHTLSLALQASLI
ncbi:MAG: D-hexose-6-phosphate mutarotase [Kiritimatiellae bacterium]|nr:D-hexose-6-phosphate mutarotase [Kiritimatiellia bacterium]